MPIAAKTELTFLKSNPVSANATGASLQPATDAVTSVAPPQSKRHENTFAAPVDVPVEAQSASTSVAAPAQIKRRPSIARDDDIKEPVGSVPSPSAARAKDASAASASSSRSTSQGGVCTAMNNVDSYSAIQFRIPYVCDGVPEGKIDGIGLLCSPTWGYDAASWLVIIFLILLWAWFGARAKTDWRREQAEKEHNDERKKSTGKKKQAVINTGGDDSSRAGPMSSRSSTMPLTTPFLYSQDGKEISPRPQTVDAVETPWAYDATTGAIIDENEEGMSMSRCARCCMHYCGRVQRCTWRFFKRMVLQLVQWWPLAMFFLCYEFCNHAIQVKDKFDIGVNTTSWSFSTPKEFDEAIPHAWIRSMSLWTNVALVVIFIFSLVSIVLQFLTYYIRMAAGCFNCFEAGFAYLSYTRNTAIQVLMLPMVYGLMSAQNVSGTWAKVTGKLPPALYCWDWNDADRDSIQDSIVESNFALADMYEAYALLCFADMLSRLLREELEKKIRMEAFKAFETILLIDVRVFCGVCITSSIYVILITWLKYRLGWDVCEDFASACILKPYIVGANWTASSVAIFNLIMTERKFSGLEAMKKFGPLWKLWTIKAMVLAAFWMTFVTAIVQDIFSLTPEENHLLDASVRIYVMMIVSVANIVAWFPWREWYWMLDEGELRVIEREVKRAADKEEKLEEAKAQADRKYHRAPSFRMKEIGVKNVPKGIIRLIKELLPDCKEPEDFEQVKEALDNAIGKDEARLISLLYKGSQWGWALTPKKERERQKVMMDLPQDERLFYLKEYLESFYPDI